MGPEQFPRVVRALILSPAALLLLASVRLLLVSDNDTTNAMSLASAGGVTGTLVGTVIPLLPIWAPFVVILFYFFRRFGLALIAAAITVVVTPAYATPRVAVQSAVYEADRLWAYLLSYDWSVVWRTYTAAVIFATLIVIFSFFGGWAGKDFVDGVLSVIGRLFTGLLFAIFGFALLATTQIVYKTPLVDWTTISAALRQPWLPAEVLTLKSGTTRTGYVLTTKDGWFSVMNEKSRQVEFIAASEVVGRRVCSLNPGTSIRPFIPLDGASANHAPRC